MKIPVGYGVSSIHIRMMWSVEHQQGGKYRKMWKEITEMCRKSVQFCTTVGLINKSFTTNV